MIAAAAALLLQAAADPAPVARSVDLAALPDRATDPTVAEALALTAGVEDDRCGRERNDAFQPDVIVVCGERPRASYRVTTVVAPVEPPPAAVDRLANRGGCGTSQNPTGCFAGVAVIRADFKGGVAILPDRPRKPPTPLND